MEPVRFVESKGLIICGVHGSDVGSAWHKWEGISEKNEIKYAAPCDANINPGAGAFEVRFYPENEGEFDFVGLQVSKSEPESTWEYLNIPSTIYAVFDIDCKIEQKPQFDGINEWISANECEYKRLKWDADGKINASEFILCIYDHQNKFGKEQIMEMWISLKKVKK